MLRRLAASLLICGTLMASPPRRQKKLSSTVGKISWYGREFHGKKMANGRRFDRNGLTAASRTYPIGTRLRLFCSRTGKSVTVTVTDRGPWRKNLLLDISEAAARQLGILRMGIATVRITPEGAAY